MKEPTMEEVQELVEFYRDDEGKLKVYRVFGGVKRDVEGTIGSVVGSIGSVWGSVHGDVNGSIYGDIEGTVEGMIGGREWEFVETPKEKIIRLIREGRGEEAIAVLQESE